MTREFSIKVDLVRNIPFLLDAIFEIGVGVVLVTRPHASTMLLIIAWTLIVIGGIHFIRKVKTFHLTNTELIIKRPLFPFRFAEDRFLISKIKEIKFINVRTKGLRLNIVTPDVAESFMIETTSEKIDEFEQRLKSAGLTPVREGI
jgi:hypothetical protein